MKIQYGKQSIEQEDIDSVVNVLKSDFLTQGPVVSKFEEEFAKEVGAKYAVAFCNATAALHAGYKSLNQHNKKVLVTPITFAASSNCVLYERGQVEFVDIDLHSFNIDIEKLEQKLNQSPDLYQGIIPVDFAGLPVDTEKLFQLAKKFGLWIMEDACHAIGGGFYNSKNQYIKCGSCTYSDFTVFSFHPVKHIATGEGGMVTTNNEALYRRLLKLRSHGIERDINFFERPSHGGWYHEMQELGYNYRMSDINAALGLSQLKRLHSNVSERNKIASYYKSSLSDLEINFQQFDEKKFFNAYHLFVIQIENRKYIFDELKKLNIHTQVHYIPVYEHPYYRKNGYKDVQLTNAETYYKGALSLPMYHNMKEAELTYVISNLRELFLKK